MRVLICDQETEMLETIARSFEVDIATSKVTCIDLMRANPFDVLVASERLSDGSGLELLSHVATRWPDTLRVLVIEPHRLKLLRGKLGPFRLHATMRYPVEEDELEAVLNRLGNLLGAAAAEEALEPEPEPDVDPEPISPPPTVRPVARPVTGSVAGSVAGRSTGFAAGSAPPAPAPSTAPRPGAGSVPRPAPSAQVVPTARSVPTAQPAQRARPAQPVPARPTSPGSPARPAPSLSSSPTPSRPAIEGFFEKPTARTTAKPAAAPKASIPPPPPRIPEPKLVRRQLGNYTPLGAPEDEQLRIVEREFDQTIAPLAARAMRIREEANRPKTPQQKAKTIAGQLGKSLRKLIKKEHDKE